MKKRLQNLGDNHAGTIRLTNGTEINYGSKRVENDAFVHYTRKGLDEIFHVNADKEKAKELLEFDEATLITSGHLAKTPISEIQEILH